MENSKFEIRNSKLTGGCQVDPQSTTKRSTSASISAFRPWVTKSLKPTPRDLLFTSVQAVGAEADVADPDFRLAFELREVGLDSEEDRRSGEEDLGLLTLFVGGIDQFDHIAEVLVGADQDSECVGHLQYVLFCGIRSRSVDHGPDFVKDQLTGLLVLGILQEELVDPLANELGVVLALVALDVLEGL